MKKKLVSSIALVLLVSPAVNAQRSYRGKSLDYIISKIGDKTYKDPNCTDSPPVRCIPYRSKMKSAGWFASDVEKREVELHNLKVRDQWFLDNIKKFPTPTEIKLSDLQEKLKRDIAAHDKARDEFDVARLTEDEAAKKLNELEETKKRLEKKQKDLKAQSLAIMNSDNYEDKAEEVEDILEELEDLDKDTKKAKSDLAKYQKLYDGKVDQFTATVKAMNQTQFEIGKTRAILGKEDKSKLSESARAELDSTLSLAEQRLQKAREDVVKDAFSKLIKEKGAADALMEDFDNLEKEVVADGGQAGLLLKLMKAKYDASALKKLVQSQIDDSITNKCPSINACMKGQINELNSDIKDVEKAIPQDKADGTSGTEK